MNKTSLLAVALIAMVCTGLGVASVSDSQLPADVKDGLQVLYLSVTDTGNNTAVVTAMMSDNELPEGFDPTTDKVGAYDVTTDEDGNMIVTDEDDNVIVIGASHNATDGSYGAAFVTITTTIAGPEGFDPITDKVGTYDVTTDEDGNVIVTDKDGNVVG